MPLYNKFRAVSSIQVVLELCMPILAIMGLQAFFKAEKEFQFKALWQSAAVVLGLIVALFLFKGMFAFSGGSDGYYLQSYGPEFVDALKEDRKSMYSADLLRSGFLIVLTAFLLWMSNKNKLNQQKTVILVGDHRQLPPTFQDGQDAHTFEDAVEQQEDAVEQQEDDLQDQSTLLTKDNFKRYEKLVTASLFRELFEKAPEILRERLTVQFRMHPDIMKMINYFYEGQLSCGNPDADRTHGLVLQGEDNVLLSPQDHLLWVDTSYDEKGAPCIDVEGSSNPVEARLIAQTLKSINDLFGILSENELEQISTMVDKAVSIKYEKEKKK